jgi:LppP/LprE lipoprotein
MCQETVRPPAGTEDREVTDAGWFLTGQRETPSGTTIILAESDADGMCRPLRYQAFVFIEGKFAGTLSPIPMNSREDGSIGPIHSFHLSRFDVAFNRYTKSDPLCCPSMQTFVSYKVETVNGRPLLVPLTATTLKPQAN